MRAVGAQSPRLSTSAVSTMKTLLFFSSLALVSSALIPVQFAALEKSTTQKIVILHDPNVEISVQKVGVLQALDDSGTYGTEYEYMICDVTLPENIEVVKGVGFPSFPQIFTQTTEAGIESYGGDFTVESFEKFHEFRKMEMQVDNVQRVKDSNGIGQVDGVAGMVALAFERPVLVKMYEVVS
jgi:hypothetical protein